MAGPDHNAYRRVPEQKPFFSRTPACKTLKKLESLALGMFQKLESRNCELCRIVIQPSAQEKVSKAEQAELSDIWKELWQHYKFQTWIAAVASPLGSSVLDLAWTVIGIAEYKII